ncbi:hypothetical protein NVS55_28670 [Myxococcus stipitatus]|uniref:hypothetical protein n=1 Tax=Myxococcus stipitatus TaxID=83455 RepID=UPI00314532D6
MMKMSFVKSGALGAWAGLALGCGGFGTSVYDIEMSEATLRAVPYVCDDGRQGVGDAWDVSANQRWTVIEGELSDAHLEVPGFFRAQLEGGFPDESPYVVGGASVEDGPFQFVGLNTIVGTDTGEIVVQRFVIEGDSLTAKRIQGFVSLRITYAPAADFKTRTCTSTVRFTGRRVDD